jgi:hypothetical protein
LSARLTPCARSRCSWLLLAWLVVGCASDLIVRAPERLRPIAPAALDQVAPQRISVGAVANVPDVSAPVGTRDGGPLQPGGPIHLTEGVGTILRRTLMETLDEAGHHIVAQNADVHVAMRVEEFTVDVARQGIAWDVIVQVRLALRVSSRPGHQTWDEISVSAERTRQVVWRPGVATVEPVLRGCLRDLAVLLSRREELGAALAKHSSRRRSD